MTQDTVHLPPHVLMLGDCLERMNQIPDGSVDMVCADLPYGITACRSWDAVIPLAPLWEQYRRILKPGGAVVLTASQPFTSILVLSNLDWFKYGWIWEKENGTNFFNAKHQPLKVHEDVVVFSPAAASYTRGSPMPYFPQMETGKPYRANNTCKGLMQFHAPPPGKKIGNDGTRYPRSVLRFQTEKGFHPTQKPVALLEYLIRTYTNEGEKVLDNCAGSFTAGIACINTERRFIGIEKDPGFFDIGRLRMEEALCQVARSAQQGGLFDSMAAE